MFRSALLSLFLAACTAPQQRREFRDGAPVRAPVVEPRTTYTPTGAGLSEYWADPEAPKPERSPYKRVLPQTPATMKEPGIWASDDPLGAVAPDILGIPIPLPPSTNADPVVDGAARACAATMNDAAKSIGLVVPEEVTPHARTCLSMRLYYYCLINASKHASADEQAKRKLAEFAGVVRPRAEAACRGVDRVFHERPFNAVAAAWRARYVKDDPTPRL